MHRTVPKTEVIYEECGFEILESVMGMDNVVFTLYQLLHRSPYILWIRSCFRKFCGK
jgi:hypothetical protein